jgi:CheY-like chemotaxis protein
MNIRAQPSHPPGDDPLELARARAELLAGLSHELRTPLNAIIGFSEALKDGLMGEMTERQRQAAGDIFDSGKRLRALFDELLDQPRSAPVPAHHAPNECASVGPCVSPPQVHGRAVRILVVDDDWRNSEVLDIALSWEGFEVATAPSGEEALAMVAESPPDLILLDVMMPGINGYEVATAVRGGASTGHIAIILFTAMSERDARSKGETSGADEILSKPLDRSELVLRVKKLLRARYADYAEVEPAA